MQYTQKYISKELHHFVGGRVIKTVGSDKKKQEDCYQLFIKLIKSGQLLANNTQRDLCVRVRINPNKKLYTNEKFDCDAVCFCDIPASDLYIHTKKYGEFGLSFTKEFLVKQGVRPVYYLPKAFKVPIQKKVSIQQDKEKRFKNISGESYFEKRTQYLLNLLSYLKRNTKLLPKEFIDQHQLERCENFLVTHFYGHLKVFDPCLGDEHVDNFYFEREWRVVGGVYFKLEDIQSIFIPDIFAKRFRNDVGKYYGQIFFL